MSKTFAMPALSPTMEKGTLARWLVSVGESVKAGDVLAEVETDKATMEIEAEEDGVVDALLVAAGAEDVPVGSAIARIAEPSSQRSASLETAASTDPGSAVRSAPPEPLAGEIAAPTQPGVDPTPSPPIVGQPPRGPSSADASPLAARIAAARGLDLARVKGSGMGGRVLLADVAPSAPPFARAPTVARAAQAEDAGGETKPSALPAPPPDIPHQSVRLSQVRRTIARRLSEAKQTIPHFYLTVHLKAAALLAQREELNGKLAGRGVKLSVNHLLIKALALALAETPEANVQFAGDSLLRFERVDLAMAVAIPDGLVTPVIRNVAAKSLSTISAEARALAFGPCSKRIGLSPPSRVIADNQASFALRSNFRRDSSTFSRFSAAHPHTPQKA